VYDLRFNAVLVTVQLTANDRSSSRLVVKRQLILAFVMSTTLHSFDSRKGHDNNIITINW